MTKLIVGRPRPDIAQLTGFSGSSFPSGHAATAAATFAAVAFLVGRRRSQWVKAIAAGIALGIATAVATSRVLLGVHWLTDVLAGLALGWGWFALCSIAFGGRILRFGGPVKTAQVAADAAPVKVNERSADTA
jgi:undecaprenyl-diphosphatase